ncbi:MAG: UTP--glucose-1-phosphate uridylyltransferase [Isosphaeraceae bacterium]
MSTPGQLLIETITQADPAVRDRSARDLVAGTDLAEKLRACEMLEQFRRTRTNLYERVRAALFLHALYRYDIQEAAEIRGTGLIPFAGFQDLMERRYEQAIAAFHESMRSQGPNGAVASALAAAYEHVAFQDLADQVRRSVRSCRGNRWMFRVGGVDEHPLRIRPELLARPTDDGLFPILVERTPVRLDLSHSGWSDIFFLGMDFPEGARVLNISVDLGVHGRDLEPLPPIECRLRVVAEPVLRLTSIDLKSCKDVDSLDELFNFGNDYLGLVKAGIVASGLVPPSLEGTHVRLADLLARIVRPGYGLEVVSKVNDIPKGSRLAVSTNLLASLIAMLMRATGQTRNLTGPLDIEESRVVVARAILGEWLGGSGGGWQDSGGVFPGIKLIRGVAASEGDPEWGVSRGRLLPEHRLLNHPTADAAGGNSATGEKPAAARKSSFADALAKSLVLVHGGMAQNVGPILNMVTEKYLLRGQAEWQARQQALEIFDSIVDCVERSDIRGLGHATTRNWDGPLKRIIPWVTNEFTETIIRESRAALGEDFWGFLMLGGMAGGGMAFFVAPERHDEFQDRIAAIMRRAKNELDDALPFAMEPVVYDFRINPAGTFASLDTDGGAMMPPAYYALQVPRMIAASNSGEAIPLERRADIDHYANHSPEPSNLIGLFRTMVNHLFPVARSAADASVASWDEEAERIRVENGFDPVQHEQLREDLQRGRIGLARNRLSVDLDVRDVDDSELIPARGPWSSAPTRRGSDSIAAGEVAVVTLAAGVGSRWTTGAGVVKAVNPFAQLAGAHRSFLEIHLAKTRRVQETLGVAIPHVVTTSYLTHAAIEHHLRTTGNYGHDGPVYLSRGQSIGQRLIPMTRDLTFLWEETSHETLDENKQKVREAGRRAILDWARSAREGSDYVDNVPIQRFNPPGHFYEVPNLLRNGVLARLLGEYPRLNWLMVHNIDTLGASVEPGILGSAIDSGATLSFEVIARRIEDRGGGLAKVGGRLRLLEGLAQPREDTEFRLRYYNTLTTWVRIDGLLEAFGLRREDLSQEPDKVAAAVRAMAARVPTYVTIKDVKRRWGHGQEDVYPVAQFEKLWGDLSSLPDLHCAFLAVDRRRGQQLKDTAQLDGWANDGSMKHVESLCRFGR